jgi:ketosteroid isomerase-like protein
MLRENVEIVRAAIDAVNRSDWDDAFKDTASGFELDLRGPSPDFGVLRGFEASLEALRQYWETFEDFQVEIEEVIHIDEEQVVTRVRDRGRLSGSDSEISNRVFQVWTFREGKLVRLSLHTDRNQALGTIGLSE